MDWPSAVVASVATASIAFAVAAVLIAVMRVGEVAVIKDGSKVGDQLLRTLAEEATASQRRVAEELTDIRLAMADMRDRVGTVERAIQEVG